MFQGGRYIRWAGGILIALAILGYAASKSATLLKGPQLTIDSPIQGETLLSPLLSISGHAKNISHLSLNDRQIYVDDTGMLLDQVLLYEGYNIITVKARDKFDREKTVVREVVYLPPEDPVPAEVLGTTTPEALEEDPDNTL